MTIDNLNLNFHIYITNGSTKLIYIGATTLLNDVTLFDHSRQPKPHLKSFEPQKRGHFHVG